MIRTNSVCHPEKLLFRIWALILSVTSLMPDEVGTGLCEAKTGRTKCNWPPKVNEP